MIYAIIAKYINLLFFSKYKRLLIENLLKNSKTTTDKTCICERQLNNFAL